MVQRSKLGHFLQNLMGGRRDLGDSFTRSQPRSWRRIPRIDQPPLKLGKSTSPWLTARQAIGADVLDLNPCGWVCLRKTWCSLGRTDS